MTMRAFGSHRLQLTPTIRLIANERLDVRAGMGESQLGEKLTECDVERVTNFLKSLTGGPPQFTLLVRRPAWNDALGRSPIVVGERPRSEISTAT
jgi:hypothetical protein